MTDTLPSPPTRLRGLDGLRAIAVSLVVVYHLFPGWWLQGGFVGLDVFFVISGFLITTLLLDEIDATGRVGLVAFWRRRARRLLPALGLLLTVCATAAWVVGGDVLVRMGAQIAGAATFSYNWVSISGGAGYFSQDTPELFRNLWSLAVEEQFYVLWPLVLPLFLLVRATWVRGVVALFAAVASAAWMAWLVTTGADLTRAYFGTDSHAFGILLGVGVAFLLRRVLRSPAGWMSRWPARALSLPVGALAIAGILVIASLPVQQSAGTFPGVLLATSLLSGIAITVGVWPGSWFGRIIDTQPLRWIGDRSYGIYLWHWTVLVLLVAWLQGTGPDAGVPAAVGIAALVVSLTAAEISYRAIERPVRQYGFRGSLRRVGRRLAGTPTARFGALAALAVWAIVLGGTSAAIAAAPPRSSAQAAVEAGQDALDSASGDTRAPQPTDPSAPAIGTPVPTSPGSDAGSPAPSPTPVIGREITAIGDSVMLASAGALLERFPGISVDAKVSRSMWAAPGILRALERSGKLRPYVVLALGTNGPIATAPLGEVLEILGPDRHLVLINAYAPRSWIPGVNRSLQAFAHAHPGVVVADWATAIRPHVGLLAGDHIHPGKAGGRIFAETVAASLDDVEASRAQRAYQDELHRYRQEQGLDENIR